MFRIVAGLLILGVLWQANCAYGQEGSLGKIRDDVKGKSDSADKRSKTDSDGRDKRSSADDDDCGGPFGFLFAAILGFLFPSDDADCYQLNGYFPSYPYAKGQPGYMWIRREVGEDEEPKPQPDFSRARGWSGRVAIEESNDFDGINRASLRLLLETGSGLGVQTNWSYVHERLSCGCMDESALGDVNLTYLFIQDEHLQMRLGLGARIISDRQITDVGFNFTIGADVYPRKPFVLSTTFDGGTLGKAGVFRAQGSVGYIYKRWEIYLGYDYLRIGSTALQGPTLGLRLWF